MTVDFSMKTSGVFNRDGTSRTFSSLSRAGPGNTKRPDVREERLIRTRGHAVAFTTSKSVVSQLPRGKRWFAFDPQAVRKDVAAFARRHPGSVLSGLVTGAFSPYDALRTLRLVAATTKLVQVDTVANDRRHYRGRANLLSVVGVETGRRRRDDQIAVQGSGVRYATVDVWISGQQQIAALRWFTQQRDAVGTATLYTSFLELSPLPRRERIAQPAPRLVDFCLLERATPHC